MSVNRVKLYRKILSLSNKLPILIPFHWETNLKKNYSQNISCLVLDIHPHDYDIETLWNPSSLHNKQHYPCQSSDISRQLISKFRQDIWMNFCGNIGRKIKMLKSCNERRKVEILACRDGKIKGMKNTFVKCWTGPNLALLPIFLCPKSLPTSIKLHALFEGLFFCHSGDNNNKFLFLPTHSQCHNFTLAKKYIPIPSREKGLSYIVG